MWVCANDAAGNARTAAITKINPMGVCHSLFMRFYPLKLGGAINAIAVRDKPVETAGLQGG